MTTPDARARLLASTQELLWERGYAATSPGAIMARSGVGQGSMYHHFAGKVDLASAAFAASAAETAGKAEVLLGRAELSPVQRLEDYLLRQREVLRGCPVGRMAQDADVLAIPELHDILESTFRRLRALVVALVHEGVAAGELPPSIRPDELADAVLAVVQGGYVLARAAADVAPFDRAVRGAVALIEAVRTTPSMESRRNRDATS